MSVESAPTRDPQTPAWKKVCSLDLSRVRARVAKEQPAWSTARLEEACVEYRRWLYLCTVRQKGESLAMICPDADQVWHAHILFTRQYRDDCMACAGRFLHHEPTSADETAADGVAKAHNTRTAYIREFGGLTPAWDAPHGCECKEFRCDCREDPTTCDGPE